RTAAPQKAHVAARGRISDGGGGERVTVHGSGRARSGVGDPAKSLGASAPAPIGLLAGNGRLPILFAEKARELGLEVVCVGIRYEAAPVLEELVHRFYWVGVSRLGGMIRSFKREGVERIVMAGKVSKAVMFTPWRVLRFCPDWRGLK